MIRLLHWLTRPQLFFYLLPYLMLLLVAGTVAQRWLGLYAAEKQYFSSFILWLGPVPLPAMVSILLLLTFSLLAKIILKSPWHWPQAGSFITHFSVLLLLIGAAITAWSSEEGFLALSEGETRQQVSDYHQRELAIYRGDTLLAAYMSDRLEVGQIISLPELPFILVIESVCRHCLPVPREKKKNGPVYRGLAQKVALSAQPPRQQDEENLFALRVRIDNAEAAQNGIYLIHSAMPGATKLTLGGEEYRLIARKAVRLLPFAVRLDAFRRTTYPGSDIAAEYESEITILDKGGQWPATIRMNEPLRYGGYTFYQSSFSQTPQGETISVLAVVKNAGRSLPYVTSLLMSFGLLLHLLLRRRNNARFNHEKTDESAAPLRD